MSMEELYDILKDIYVTSYNTSYNNSVITIPCGKIIDFVFIKHNTTWGDKLYYSCNIKCQSWDFQLNEHNKIIDFLDNKNCHSLGRNIKG